MNTYTLKWNLELINHVKYKTRMYYIPSTLAICVNITLSFILVFCYLSNLVSINNRMSNVTFSYLWFVFGADITQTIKYCSYNWHRYCSECRKIQRDQLLVSSHCTDIKQRVIEFTPGSILQASMKDNLVFYIKPRCTKNVRFTFRWCFESPLP